MGQRLQSTPGPQSLALWTRISHHELTPLHNSILTLSLFLSTIIKELGYTVAQAQLLTVPPYAVATILIILLSSRKAVVSYFGTILAASGIYPATAIVLSWPANNDSG